MSNDQLAGWGAFVLRVGLGVALIAHGLLKVFVFTVPGTVGFFESIGYPAFAAYLVIAGELGLGALLVLGLYVRAAALATLPIMIGAALVHLPNGWVFSNQGGGWEYPVFWSVALIAQALLGPGALALKLPLPGARPAAVPA